jgi:hypothetical protein
MMQLLLCVLFCVLVLAPPIFADDGENDIDSVITELCQNGMSEGRYAQSFGNVGESYAYLICTSASTMVAVVWSKGPRFSLNMAHTAVNGDSLFFTAFDPSPDAARGALANDPDPRLKLSLTALRHGSMQGEYRTTLLKMPVAVSASRLMAFPNLIAQVNPAFDYKRIVGRFVIDRADQLKDIEAVAPGHVAIDIIGQRLRVNLNDSKNLHFGLYNGLVATGAENAHNVVYASSGVDDSLGGKFPFIHLRGLLVNEDQMDLYFFGAQYGLVGPISAHRDKSAPALEVPPKRK